MVKYLEYEKWRAERNAQHYSDLWPLLLSGCTSSRHWSKSKSRLTFHDCPDTRELCLFCIEAMCICM